MSIDCQEILIMAATNAISKEELEDLTIIFNGVISQGKTFTLDIDKKLVATIPLVKAMAERWTKQSAQKDTINLNMDPKKNILPSSIEKYFNLKQLVSDPTNNITDTLSQFDCKIWLDLFEINVHFADFPFYDEYIIPNLPNYKMFSHSIYLLPAHMAVKFGEKYFNDCLVTEYPCTICMNYDFYYSQKEKFDKLSEDIKEKIYSIFKNGCLIHDHNTSFFTGCCKSPTCPDKSFKIDGWDVLELGHILHNLAEHIKSLSEPEKADFNKYIVDDLCTCHYFFDDTFIKFVKTDRSWAEYVWNHCYRIDLLSLFDLEKKIIGKLAQMNFDQFIEYIDEHACPTLKNIYNPHCRRFRFSHF